jgi:hypothetical protein
MTLKLIEGFDHYGDVDALMRQWRSPNKALVGIGGGRIETALAVQGGGLAALSLIEAMPTLVLGFSYYHYGDLGTGGTLVSLLDATPDATTHIPADLAQLTLAYDADGFYTLWRGDVATGTLLATSDPFTLGNADGTFSYVEIKATIGATGSVVVRIDGTDEVISYSGNTQATANAYASGIAFGGAAAAPAILYYDDVYVLSLDGDYNSDWLGDVKARPLRPTGDFTQLQDWNQFPTSGAPYDHVNAVPPNMNRVVYNVNTSLEGAFEFFLTNDIPDADVVHGVGVTFLGKTDGTAEIGYVYPIIAIDSFNSGQNGEGSTRPGVGALLVATPAYFSSIFEHDPRHAEDPITAADINRPRGLDTFDERFAIGLIHVEGPDPAPAWTNGHGNVQSASVMGYALVTGIGSTDEIRLTQYPIEALSQVVSADRQTDVTQVAIEVTVAPGGTARPARVSQVAIEAAVAPGSAAKPVRVSQAVVEVLVFLNGHEPTPTPRSPTSQAQIAG